MSKTSDISIIEAMERAGRAAALGDNPGDDQDVGSGNQIAMFETDRGVVIELPFHDNTMWATQRDMAELFGVTRNNITMHLRRVFEDGELEPEATSKESLLVRTEGNREVEREVTLYNLDAIISVGYRVNSRQGTMFRRWATDKLVQYAVKGFVIDDARLKTSEGNQYFAELRERIRDIRASEANVFKEIREICALCSDYDPKSQASRNFFMTMQNRTLWAVTSMTAPQIVMDRANAQLDNMGLTAWTGARGVVKKDISVAKNYLSETEVTELNRLTNMILDYFEDQAERQRVVTMAGLDEALVRFMEFNNRPVLEGPGDVSRPAADQHARNQYEAYQERRRRERQRAGEAALVELIEIGKQLPAEAKRRTKRKPSPKRKT